MEYQKPWEWGHNDLVHKCMQSIYIYIYIYDFTLCIVSCLKDVSYAHQDCIYLIKNTVKNSNIVKNDYSVKYFLFEYIL